MRLLPLTVLLLAGACSHAGTDLSASQGAAARLPADWLRPVASERLAELADSGLPESSQDELREIADLVDAAAAGGRVGRLATRDLEEREPAALCSALLGLVEGREITLQQRRACYGWLEARGIPAIVPRLVLRLKYEKDWQANATLARALLTQGNGAGLEALRNILAREDSEPDARRAAAGALMLVPGHRPGNSFQEDWQNLLALRELWHRERLLVPGSDASLGDRDLETECWRMIDRMRSQPLRPVDDARFVLTRMSCAVVPLLLEAGHDSDRYLREHAYQTVAWIGYPAGRWLRRHGIDPLPQLATALADPEARLRVLEAVGALGLAGGAELALPWLGAGNADERVAAADALLRCAEAGALPGVREALQDKALPAEARLSLELLLVRLDPEAVLPISEDFEEILGAERDRRERWLAERADRPR